MSNPAYEVTGETESLGDVAAPPHEMAASAHAVSAVVLSEAKDLLLRPETADPSLRSG
jgi:hypothetical protein